MNPLPVDAHSVMVGAIADACMTGAWGADDVSPIGKPPAFGAFQYRARYHSGR